MIDSPLITNLIFHPRKLPLQTYLPQDIKALKFDLGADIIITGYIAIKDSIYPTLLLFHGNAELAYELLDLKQMFFKCGWNFAVVDYRGYGASSGRSVYSTLYQDAIPIYTSMRGWLKHQGLNSNIIVMGRSLGGNPASEIGGYNPEGLLGLIFQSTWARLSGVSKKFVSMGLPDPMSSLGEKAVSIMDKWLLDPGLKK